jgi:YfiH family protein
VFEALSHQAAEFLRLPPGAGCGFAVGPGPARQGSPAAAGFWELRQTHSDRLHEVVGGSPAAGTEGDGLFTRQPAAILGVKSADCLPLLLHAPDLGAVAAVHAGWRGLAQDLPAKISKTLHERGAAPASLRVVLGPAICQACYEVGPELGEKFQVKFGAGGEFVPGRGDRLQFSQSGFARKRLEATGVKPENILALDACTKETPALPSFRRDGEGCGRLFSMIWLG